jgi:hypothetical protein
MIKAALETKNKKLAELEAQLTDAKKPFEEAIERLKNTLGAEVLLLKSKVIELEKENATMRVTLGALNKLSGKRGSATLVTMVGDEASLTKVKANPRDYISKEFVIVGGLAVDNYFNYGYLEAEKTHVSLYLRETRADGSLTGEYAYLYLSRSISAALVEAITKTVDEGYGGKIVRVKVAILRSRNTEGSSSPLAELLDWQFLNAQGTGWQPWAIGAKTAGTKTPGVIPPGSKVELLHNVVERFLEQIRGTGDFERKGADTEFRRLPAIKKAQYILDHIGADDPLRKDIKWKD